MMIRFADERVALTVTKSGVTVSTIYVYIATEGEPEEFFETAIMPPDSFDYEPVARSADRLGALKEHNMAVVAYGGESWWKTTLAKIKTA